MRLFQDLKSNIVSLQRKYHVSQIAKKRKIIHNKLFMRKFKKHNLGFPTGKYSSLCSSCVKVDMCGRYVSF